MMWGSHRKGGKHSTVYTTCAGRIPFSGLPKFEVRGGTGHPH